MTLENSIKDVIAAKLADGVVETLISEQLEKGIKNALDSMFGSYGDVTKIIEKQVKSVMIPYLENYDYSDYIVKLDNVLVEVLKNSSLENKKILGNFKSLIEPQDELKTIKVSELYEKWMKYVAENVKTDDLEINYDEGVSYEPVEVSYNIDYNEDKSWSSFEYAVLNFECEHDEEMNFTIRLSRWKKDKKEGWDIGFDQEHTLKSLRHLNDFEIYLMKLTQNYTKLIIDEDGSSDEVIPDKEPEASYN
ncbi:hypothetical protein [Paenibacillus cremeus]|uniref:Uncharacterized protein n=1 Tax=Paenibacillus cremeus TaxID=2163881 RepID=A0A559KCL7_9BACL|nr:hypothetical protein [Paenibacillus cremeus]TVY09853.1 hypothetical protein FPZ49_10800 [Paenibacillus cremeus]